MAEFLPILKKTFNVEGGYQSFPQDVGNYTSSGKLVGTNKGIAAITLEAYLGREPSVAEMKALTTEKATAIYRTLFWDRMLGDLILSQSVALIFWEAFVASGNLMRPRKAINKYYGKTVVSEKNLRFGNTEINYTNNADARKLFNIAWQQEVDQRHARVATNPSQAVFLAGWLNRLNSVKFTDNVTRNTVITGLGLMLISFSLYLTYKYKLI